MVPGRSLLLQQHQLPLLLLLLLLPLCGASGECSREASRHVRSIVADVRGHGGEARCIVARTHARARPPQVVAPLLAASGAALAPGCPLLPEHDVLSLQVCVWSVCIMRGA